MGSPDPPKSDPDRHYKKVPNLGSPGVQKRGHFGARRPFPTYKRGSPKGVPKRGVQGVPSRGVLGAKGSTPYIPKFSKKRFSEKNGKKWAKKSGFLKIETEGLFIKRGIFGPKRGDFGGPGGVQRGSFSSNNSATSTFLAKIRIFWGDQLFEIHVKPCDVREILPLFLKHKNLEKHPKMEKVTYRELS